MRRLAIAATVTLALAGCGGGSTKKSSTAIAVPTASAWCAASPGASHGALERLMGAGSKGDTSESWTTGKVSFYAFFEPGSDAAWSLEMNTVNLSDAEKANLPCGVTRR